MQSIFFSFSKLLATLAAAFGLGTPATAQRSFTPEFIGRVIHVNDGDTLVAMRANGGKTIVRLANIDAPETQHGRCRPGQPYAQKSGSALKAMVLGKTVEFTCSTMDRYERHVCDVHIGDTTANRELVRQGLAWANRANASYLRDPQVVKAEREAQEMQRGIWADGLAVRPWIWRREQWKNSC